MKLLLFGARGQLGWELKRALAPLGTVVALDRAGVDGLVGDLTDNPGIAATVARVQPDVIVNAAAYTAVDKAESEPQMAHLVNAEAPGSLAQIAARENCLLVHFSTDYVFNGHGTKAWTETDPTGPLNVYGSSKLAGEQAIRASGCQHLILRTSWVYAARGANFARTMLRLAAEREGFQVVDDQFGAPTGAELLADVSAQMIPRALADGSLSGLYHIAASGESSWYDYARFVIATANRLGFATRATADNVEAVPSSAFATAAPRPANSRLDTHKLQNAFGLHLPHWQTGVERMLAEILEPKPWAK